MRALTVQPGHAGSVSLEDVAEPPAEAGSVLVRTLAVGVCGTDAEIVAGRYGWAPPERARLVLGHESVGEVAAAPPGCGLVAGDLVVGIVRRPDPVPCGSCAAGEWDMCRNGLYTEHGIKALDGFCVERFRSDPQDLVRADPSLGRLAVLTEPTSVVAKAWEHAERIGRRAHWEPRRVLVTGAGTVGLLAALLARQRGFEVHVFDRVTEGRKPELARALGAHYHHGSLGELIERAPPDVVLECTGASAVVLEVMCGSARGGVVCLVGVSAPGSTRRVDLGALDRSMVLENDVVFGSVNANRRHYEAAARALERAERGWLERLVSRRVPLERWPEALERRPEDVKVVLDPVG